ncbi:helicase (plasmid) [Frondihabitans sucicola]|uniref:Helicase n=1 Tax=Frondihabitans sucicola TaxID=1268041 RepID=A0ABM8GVW2_9MICO|nr:helicase [Frondihabitans sucicola]
MATRKTMTRRPVARKAASTTATRAESPNGPPKPPQADVTLGERVFLLKVPFAERALATYGGAKYLDGYGWTYVGRALPAKLEPYAAPQYSWEEYQMGDLARVGPGSRSTTFQTGDFTLRPDQVEDRDAVIAAHKAGAPEFLIGSDTGVGKTVTAIAALKAMPVRNIVVIAPLSVIASWRMHLKIMGDGGKRWALINYDSAKNLLWKPPAKISKATGKAVNAKRSTLNKSHARDGAPRVAWDVVVTDESHYVSNVVAQRSTAIERVIGNPASASPAFVVRMSATAGANPAQLAYLHRGLAYVSGERVRRAITPEEYVEWCVARGLKVSVDRYDKLSWEPNDRDLKVMNGLLFGERTLQWGLRRVPEDWPEQQRNLVPIEFDADERAAYELAWDEFQQTLSSLGFRRGVIPRKGAEMSVGEKKRLARAAQIRYRQKAGLIRAAQSVEYIKTLLDSGVQVAVNCEYRGTVSAIEEHLRAAKIEPALFLGGDPHREDQRVAFQQGKHQVIIFTPPEAFSLHAGERAVGGNTVPRALFVAEPRWSPRSGLQIEGRTQRNGEASSPTTPSGSERSSRTSSSARSRACATSRPSTATTPAPSSAWASKWASTSRAKRTSQHERDHHRHRRVLPEESRRAERLGMDQPGRHLPSWRDPARHQPDRGAGGTSERRPRSRAHRRPHHPDG